MSSDSDSECDYFSEDATSYPFEPVEFNVQPQVTDFTTLTPEEALHQSSALLDRLRTFLPEFVTSTIQMASCEISGSPTDEYIQMDLYPGVLALQEEEDKSLQPMTSTLISEMASTEYSSSDESS
ncbi:hypothetical protein RCL1_003635 [Eukaryota sp. TZLM3-RCL]